MAERQEEAPGKDIEAEFVAEKEQAKQKLLKQGTPSEKITEEEVIHTWLNNFHKHLPPLEGDGIFDNYRKLYEKSIDKPFRELAVRDQSETLAAKTPRQFFADFDTAIKANGVELNKINELQKAMKLTSSHALTLEDKEFEEMQKAKVDLKGILLPVYKHLRKQGYSQRDLIT